MVASAHVARAQEVDPSAKKPASSWKLPPSKSGSNTAPAGDSRATPTNEGYSAAEASATVAAAHALRIESARAGAVGAWCDSVQIYFTQSTEVVAPATISAVSSPTLIAFTDASIGLFVQRYPTDDPSLFGSIARAMTSDGGIHWSELEPCAFVGLPETMDGPEHPCVCAAGAGRLRMFFIARDYELVDAPRSVMSALSTDEGRTWRVEAEKRMPLEGRLAAQGEVVDISAATVGSSAHILLAQSSENDPLVHAVAIDDGALVMRPKFAAPAGGSWRGSARSEKGEIVFTGMRSNTAEFVRARSRTGREWKPESIEASSRPSAEEVIDLSWFVNAAGDRHLFSVVTRDEHPLAQSPLATSPATPTDGAPPNPEIPLSNEEGVAEEAAPKARRSSDPVAAPVAPKVSPLGGKKSAPVGAERGPVPPGLGGP